MKPIISYLTRMSIGLGGLLAWAKPAFACNGGSGCTCANPPGPVVPVSFWGVLLLVAAWAIVSFGWGALIALAIRRRKQQGTVALPVT